MEPYSVLTTLCAGDNPAFLEQSIESMLHQSVFPNDYVLVLDGPIPEILDAVVRRHQTANPVFHVVKLPENVGLGAALATGLLACKNELVARLDADDISQPDRCALQLAEFAKTPQLAVVGTDLYEFDDDPARPTAIKTMPRTSAEIYKYGKRRNPFNHSSVMFRKSVVLEAGNYSPMRRSQDVELWGKIVFRGYPCENLPLPLVGFRTNGPERVRRKKKWSNVRADLRVFRGFVSMGYASWIDYAWVLATQLAFWFLPQGPAARLYRAFFRKRPESAP